MAHSFVSNDYLLFCSNATVTLWTSESLEHATHTTKLPYIHELKNWNRNRFHTAVTPRRSLQNCTQFTVWTNHQKFEYRRRSGLNNSLIERWLDAGCAQGRKTQVHIGNCRGTRTEYNWPRNRLPRNDDESRCYDFSTGYLLYPQRLYTT